MDGNFGFETAQRFQQCLFRKLYIPRQILVPLVLLKEHPFKLFDFTEKLVTIPLILGDVLFLFNFLQILDQVAHTLLGFLVSFEIVL